jgi:hypothetical protein
MCEQRSRETEDAETRKLYEELARHWHYMAIEFEKWWPTPPETKEPR